MKTGKLVQMDADQIYAKAKETDQQLGNSGTYPDLALAKALELIGSSGGGNGMEVKTSKSDDVNVLKRAIHSSMFASVNMVVTNDIYDLD